MVSADVLRSILTHLGGQAVLAQIGARDFVSDDDHVSFRLAALNPNNVCSVVISLQPIGMFNMDCYGPIDARGLSAPLIGAAKQIIPENLATVLGQLTGMEIIHHRHF